VRGEEGDGEAPDEEGEDGEGDGEGGAAAAAPSTMAAARVSSSWAASSPMGVARVSSSWLVDWFGEVGWPGPVGIRRVWAGRPFSVGFSATL
jgi:hypothetical protein